MLFRDRKSTRLNSSHLVISYAVFCLKKKTNTEIECMSPQQRRLRVTAYRARAYQRLHAAARVASCLAPALMHAFFFFFFFLKTGPPRNPPFFPHPPLSG